MSKHVEVFATKVLTLVKKRQIYDMKEGKEKAVEFEFKISV